MWHFNTHRFLWLFLSYMFCAKDLCGCLLSLLGFVAIPGLQPFRMGQVMISHGICVSKFSSWINIETTHPLPCLKQHLYCHHRGGVVFIFFQPATGLEHLEFHDSGARWSQTTSKGVWWIFSGPSLHDWNQSCHQSMLKFYEVTKKCRKGSHLPILGVHSIDFYVDPLPGSPEHLCGDWDETYWCVSAGA